MNEEYGSEPSRLLGVDEICAWFNKARVPHLDKDRIAQLYFNFLPRTAFLKTLAPGSEVVDVGAGDGSLAVFRSWPEPNREDLRFYAYSIEKGRYFDQYSGYEISDWNVSPPEFDGKCFDAMVCAHFIEHIQDPESLVRWAARKLRSGGRIYLEWPSPHSLSLPSRSELDKRGVPLIISRFDDDDTHRALPDGDAIADALRNNGFAIESRGIIRLPWLEEELLGHYKDAVDGFYRQAAFWSYTGWSQYIVAELSHEGGDVCLTPAHAVRDASAKPSHAQIAALCQSLAALQAAHVESASHVKSLAVELAWVRELVAEEQTRTAAERLRWTELEEEKRRLIAEHQEVRRNLTADMDNLRRGHEQVLGSRSWKLTKPLRAVANWLRRR